MRRIAKADKNQKELDAAARAVGASVLPLHQLGSGVPDRLIAYRGVNYLVEYKSDPTVSHRKAKQLTPDQVKFFSEWKGIIYTVETAEELLKVIGAMK